MNENIAFLYDEENNPFRNIAMTIDKIGERLGDEISRTIFYNRLLFSMTGDPKLMAKVIETTEIGKMFVRKFHEVVVAGQNLYIYGAGRRGKRLVDMYNDIHWTALIDRKANVEIYEKTYKGIPIIGLEDVKAKDSYIILTNATGYQQIKIDLIQMGIDEDRIIVLREYDVSVAENMYFEQCIVGSEMNPDTYFIDGGGYNGFSTLCYMDTFFKDKDVEPLAAIFEPDPQNAELCKTNMREFKKVDVHTLGLSDRIEELAFAYGMGEGSAYGKDGNIIVKTGVLDQIYSDKLVGFIKMDVEGSEYQALRGAEQIIKKQHPILAISVYHKRSDIYRLPELIMSMNDNYTFYFRHYTLSYGDTVLYAVDKK